MSPSTSTPWCSLARCQDTFSRRGTAPGGVAREVPPARRPAGAAHDRAGVDRARPVAARLPHAAHRGGLAAGHLGQARLGTLPGMVRTGQTFALVAEEYLDDLAHDRQRNPSTLRDVRSVLPEPPGADLRARARSRTSPSMTWSIGRASCGRSRRLAGRALARLNQARPHATDDGGDRACARQLRGCVGAAAEVQAGSEAGWPATPAISRPAPHLRHVRDRKAVRDDSNDQPELEVQEVRLGRGPRRALTLHRGLLQRLAGANGRWDERRP
jgi:hypothetical protein